MKNIVLVLLFISSFSAWASRLTIRTTSKKGNSLLLKSGLVVKHVAFHDELLIISSETQCSGWSCVSSKDCVVSLELLKKQSIDPLTLSKSLLSDDRLHFYCDVNPYESNHKAAQISFDMTN